MWGGNGNTTGLGTRHGWMEAGSTTLSFIGTLVSIYGDSKEMENGNMTDHRFEYNTSVNIGLLGASLFIPGANLPVLAISAVNATPAGDIAYAQLFPLEYQYGSKSNAMYLNTWHMEPIKSWHNNHAEFENAVDSYDKWREAWDVQKERERKLKYLYKLR